LDRLKALQYFIAVAEKGSFTTAAKSLGVPPSSVSRRIQDLEEALGVDLVYRTTRVVELTELGTLYLDHIRPGVSSLAHADELMATDTQRPSGRLRVTAIPDYGRHCVLPALAKLKKQYPLIVLDIELTDQVSNMANNDVDIAIRATATLPSRSVARKVSENDFIMVASPQYINQQGLPVTVAELESHQKMVYRRPDGLLHWQVQSAAGWTELSGSPAYISNQGDALVEQAQLGSGIALVPSWGVVNELENGSLVQITIDKVRVGISRNPNSAIYLLYRRPKYSLAKVKTAVDFLVYELTDQQNKGSE
jgi:DNA-binding transcriptional LysR family regulator